MNRSRDLGLLVRLLRQSRGNGRRIAVLVVVSLLASPLALLGPLPLKLAVDSVLANRPLPPVLAAIVPAGVLGSPTLVLLSVAVLALAVTLLSKLQNLAQVYLTASAGERMVLELRSQMFRRLQHISLAFHDTAGTADSLYRVQSDAVAVRNIVVDGMVPFVSSAATFLGMVYVTARLDWQVAAAALVVTPVLLLFVRAYRPKQRRRSRLAKKSESLALGVVQEVLGALRVVKAFRREEGEQKRFIDRSSESMRQRLRASLSEGTFAIVVGVLMALGTAGVLFIGVSHVEAGILTLGNLLLVMGYVAKLYDPLTTTARKIGMLQTHFASLERAFAILEIEPEVEERPNARRISRARGEVEFQDVSFRYAENANAALSGISFRVKAGTRVGIIGSTGAGKSTLVSLLMRFYDPTEGTVLLDGIDLREYRLDDLRRQFAYMPQDPVLFSLTIAENIAYGAPDATREQVVEAARAANAAPFIEALPERYDTMVGERGVTLSGGERQRIALARAFLLDAPILLLDEPTSALDFRTEAAVADAMTRLQLGRTVLVISHRPTALEHCAKVLKLERGRLVPVELPRNGIPAAGPGGAAPALHGGDVASHPAVQAWLALRPSGPMPIGIVPGQRKHGKVRTFLLEGAGPDGGTVFAKNSGRSEGSIERALYERIFPWVDAAVPPFLGTALDRTGSPWLFTGATDGGPYLSLAVDHRVLSGRWLASLHSGAPGALSAEVRSILPDAGPARSLRHLRYGKQAVLTSLSGAAVSDGQRAIVDGLVAVLDRLEAGWDRIVEAAALLPPTLVHGDFNGKNMRVRETDPRLVVFDWEDAGWGSPAVDLAQQLTSRTARLAANPDLDEYLESAQVRRPRIRREDLERCAWCGTVFRVLACLEWSTVKLSGEWTGSVTDAARLYLAELEAALERLGSGRGAHPVGPAEAVAPSNGNAGG